MSCGFQVVGALQRWIKGSKLPVPLSYTKIPAYANVYIGDPFNDNIHPRRSFLNQPIVLHATHFSGHSDCEFLKGKGKVIPVLYASRHEDVFGEWKYSSTHT
jgi:hypothetical protein